MRPEPESAARARHRRHLSSIPNGVPGYGVAAAEDGRAPGGGQGKRDTAFRQAEQPGNTTCTGDPQRRRRSAPPAHSTTWRPCDGSWAEPLDRVRHGCAWHSHG
jgi:hypothetical protein